jgi:hypothetical protein
MEDERKLSDQPEPEGRMRAISNQRKPYVKPGFTWERAFETMALACGKLNASQAQCKSNRKNS